MKKTYQINTPRDFESVIQFILNNWESDNLVIALSGDLGAGKTTFVQQLAKYLGISETVNSPTFTVMKQYEIPQGKFDTLVHIDAYRLESEAEVAPLRLSEYLERSGMVACVEWPERISTIIPKQVIRLYIAIEADDVREVVVSVDGTKTYENY